jgi:tetratricopeptide (TPR) repeat protein
MAPESNSGPNYGILTHRFVLAGQWDRALTSAQDWLARDPENLRAHRTAAQALINLNRSPEAEKHLEKTLAGNPNDDFAHRLMALVHFRAGKFRLADESIQKAIALNPVDAFHWHQLAHMSYRQGDLAGARKSVARARELNPRNADILNLAILCEPNGPETAEKKIQQFKDALALDPENANIYNNIGAQYLDRLKDYAKAEEYFRQALFFNPASKMFRKNLFITVKKRDLIYRVLCAPKDWLFRVINFFGRIRKQSLLLYLLMIPIWLFLFRFILAGLALWFGLVWPLTKVYEYLTIGDIRARAGELGARRGGLFGYRQWPVSVRLSLFAFLLVLFWCDVALVFFSEESAAGSMFLYLVIIGLVLLIVLSVGRKTKKSLKARAVRKRAKRMEGVFSLKRGG